MELLVNRTGLPNAYAQFYSENPDCTGTVYLSGPAEDAQLLFFRSEEDNYGSCGVFDGTLYYPSNQSETVLVQSTGFAIPTQPALFCFPQGVPQTLSPVVTFDLSRLKLKPPFRLSN